MNRLSLIRLVFSIWFVAVIVRLYYWQAIMAPTLQEAARKQYERSSGSLGNRGVIYSDDGYPLVLNQSAYTLIGKPNLLKVPISVMSQEIISAMASAQATPSAWLAINGAALSENLTKKLSDPNKKWVPLVTDLTGAEKDALNALGTDAITFETYNRRSYPESSMSANLLGFVGKNAQGDPQGYFGIEGAYDLELKGRATAGVSETDAIGHPIGLTLTQNSSGTLDGRNLTLTLRRDIQFIAQQYLDQGIQTYGAKAGDVVIMEPQTGKILAMASSPSYDPATYASADPGLFRNPIVADGYEPGSTFKVVTVAAAIDAGVITPDTQCDACSGPVTIGKYTIRTWDNKYHPNSTIQEGLTHSDNTVMVFVGGRLGKDRFLQAIQNFGIGQKTGIDVQDESSPRLRAQKEWGDIDLATATFGQGIALTPIQMLNSVNVVANGGWLMKPYVVEKVASDGEQFVTKPQALRRVISEQTAKTVAQMMQTAASQGDAKWTLPKQYPIAGKTGTAQIPVSGHYDPTRTTASFVGFAPPDNPKFSMLVRLVEPQTSQWGSETAAPLWFAIAKELFVKYGITPTQNK